MSNPQEKLNIVDENDNIVGKESREKIHKEGLLHREINVWFYNKKGEVIFQKRAMDQDTNPGLLDATAGGHTDLGEDYDKAAIREIGEETGLKLDLNQLRFIKKVKFQSIDKQTDAINNRFQHHYVYEYNDDINKLLVSEGQGFELWPIEKILNVSEEDKEKFVLAIFGKEQKLEVFREIKKLIK